MIVIVFKAVFLKLFQTKDHLANKKKLADHLTEKYIPGTTGLLPRPGARQLLAAHDFRGWALLFLRTGRLVIDMTSARQSIWNPAPCVTWLCYKLVRSQPHTPITHSDRHHTTQPIGLNTTMRIPTTRPTAVIQYQQ